MDIDKNMRKRENDIKKTHTFIRVSNIHTHGVYKTHGNSSKPCTKQEILYPFLISTLILPHL